MPELLKAPVTPAQQARDTLLGALVGLARATTNEPKTDDTDEVLKRRSAPCRAAGCTGEKAAADACHRPD